MKPTYSYSLRFLDMKDEDLTQIRFDETITKLEEVVKLLENPLTGLERSLELFKEAKKFESHCQAQLESIKSEFTNLNEIGSSNSKK